MGMKPATELRARGLSFMRGTRTILEAIDFTLRPGEIVALLGVNGAGKSTLFHLLLALTKPTTGHVDLDGRDMAHLGRRVIARQVAYVPQIHVASFPYRVRDVVLLGRIADTGLLRAVRTVDREIADAVLERLGIAHLAECPYTEISGGERQLTLIARALAQGARLLLLDEPMTGLDFGRQIGLLDHLRGLAADGHGILFSTHHPEHAMRAATRVCIISGGTITADGPPCDVVTPDTIEKLYGVRVVACTDARHGTVFLPATSAHAAPAGRPSVPLQSQPS
jgi:iron complex transport system ATP-binding protein